MLKDKLIYIFLLFCILSFGQNKMFGQSKMKLASIQQASGGVANLFDGVNAADPENEVNGTANTSVSGSDFVISSVTTGPTPFDGSYSLLFTKNTANGVDAIGYIDCPGVSNGDSVSISIRVQEVSGTSWTFSLRDFLGWAATDSQSITAVGSWVEYTFTGTATQDNPIMEVKANTIVNLNQEFAVDAVNITIVP